MSTLTKEIPYHCDNNCVPQGCPGHIAEITYQPASDYVTFNDGQHSSYGFDLNRLEAFLEGLGSFTFRVEIDKIFARAYSGPHVH